MPSYMSLFRYTSEACEQMLRSPSDRSEAARATVEEAGGTMESFYWLLGEHDGFLVFHMPDEQAAAAYSATVRASGRIESHVTHQIVDMEAARGALDMAKQMRRGYRPPGAAASWRAEYDTLGD
ncbi:MAG: GYD domain-containing protein [Thermoleophilia bacterium]|nr:GYD domain-containing protein [Thermoleophilia bacterium]MDH3724329.1 GYD domain-containing protein [Thermoleophilia bacterium]